ncbi:hypothetical protein P691DRAFT_107842 [Macrolepiota fuliginosa MF-IS2]|uniref:Uncharacterized protein n=1 Tax=Macrolepiota fuliginosa MF-IS2 TaxID=1400762 RepID=A0A9P6BWJ6_9AGAR|nr:hypothetical protein P691DRAFT_107842 [Macrolepiota fuliginosa MF-IS2]
MSGTTQALRLRFSFSFSYPMHVAGGWLLTFTMIYDASYYAAAPRIPVIKRASLGYSGVKKAPEDSRGFTANPESTTPHAYDVTSMNLNC